MAGYSGRYWLGVRAVALTLAYALVLQLLLASLHAGRAAGDQLSGDPLSAAGQAICLNAAASTAPAGDGGDRPAIAHCPLCTLRADIALPPAVAAGKGADRPAFPVAWAPDLRAPPRASLSRTAHHPRGPPAARFLA
ncbi:hypothetical protein KHC23_05805 [Ancylobacter dichloromethanicus]|uniref:DUF2946 domain-containing protein n=1 Tax=Ancylobacter dichloromethanicus TaxID=518825 RepID=A0A9W6JC64_9HYPH|nr:DUF2946 family protein [Ancylobacter dichloromethanicus]MBS7553161.1 hypothetical protein [Ancylobacter dichloromethanicus]GLK72938.1 hypothetical protein GCM10017643_30540 [Ancylobacter dichloromethanicus]